MSEMTYYFGNKVTLKNLYPFEKNLYLKNL